MRWPLSRRILGLALINLALVALVLLAFAEWQVGLNVESLVLGPAHDRISAIGNTLGLELELTPYADRDQLLATYAQRYGVDLYLVGPRGEPIAGPAMELPSALMRHFDDPRRRDNPPPRDTLPPDRNRDRERGRQGGLFLQVTHNPLFYWVGFRMPVPDPEEGSAHPGILLLRATSLFNSKLFFDWRSVLLLGLALTAVALLCWWPFIHGLTKSIRQMDRATERIAQGHFEAHALHDRSDELGHLGVQINRMAIRLEGFVKNQKRFLGDIAHELCAPIARIQFALGILEQRSDGAHVEVLREEIQEMSALVNELLMFSKAGIQAGEIPLARVDVNTAVQRAVAHQMPGSATIQVALEPTLTAVAHEGYLVRAISNLLRNALRYAGENGPITVSTSQENGRIALKVSDCGPGLPEGELEHVFTPLYRPESSRSRDSGGSGLGLAIVKSCVEACRGTVACRNRVPSGLEVTISLPAAP